MLITLTFCLSPISLHEVYATDSTWVNGGTGDWNKPGNWSNGIPSGPSDRGLFTGNFPNTITFSKVGANTVGEVAFSSFVTYTFDIGLSIPLTTRQFTLNAAGVTGAFPPIFNVNANSTLTFAALSDAGNNSLTHINDTAQVIFQNFATADNATIINNAAAGINNGVNVSGMSTGISIGSLSGSGPVVLGSTTLTLGNLNTNDNISGAISGTGALTKIGTHTLTLSGINTYGGNTTISGGTLTFTGNTSGLSGNIIDNAALIFNQASNSSFGGIISGSGTLTKSNIGILTLSGANTYTHDTTIDTGGTISIAAVNGIGDDSSTNNLTLDDGTLQTTATFTSARGITLNAGGGTFNVSPGITTTFNGNIGGTGALTKTGTGTLILGGANLFYGGITTINAGTLTFTGDTTNLTGGMSNATAVVFDQAADSTFAGNISGAGTLTKSGAGNLTLISGGNTYTGGTTITGGTLTGNTTSLTGNIVDDAALVFDQAAAGTFAGDISGTGSFTKLGIGNLTLSGANTYGGLTTISGGTLTFTGDTAGLTGNMSNATAVVFDQAANSSFGKIISGGGTLTKSDTGILTLSGANTYTGTTTVNGGILQGTITTATALTVTNPGVFNLTASQTIGSLSGDGDVTLNAFSLTTGGNNTSTTYAGIMSGTGGLTKTGTGTFTLLGANTYTGGTTITGGTLRGNTTGLTGNITDNAALVFDQATADTFAGVISGTGSFTKLGAENLTLSGVNTYTGSTTITAGTLTFTGDTTNLTGGMSNATAVVFDQAADSTFAGNISGAGSFTKLGAGNLTLSGTNTYTGGTTITAGTLRGNTTSLTGNIIDNAALAFDQAAAGTFAGDISGTGSFTKSGAGNLTLSGANTYTGVTTVNGGILQGTIPTATALTVTNPGVFNLTASQTIGSLSGNGGVTLNAFNLTTGGDNTSTTYSGILSGAGGLTKTGAGTFTLLGANTYTGGTTITAGTLTGKATSLTGNIIDNAALVFIQTAATVGTFAGDISGTGTFTKLGAGNLTLSGTNTYTGGTTVTEGTLTGNTTSLTGNIVDNAALVFDQAAAGTFTGNISGTGAFAKLGAGNLTLSGTNTYTGGTTITAGILTGNTTSLTGNIVDNAALVFNQTSAGTFAGIINGTGTFTKSGAGNLTLSGANTYTGVTTVNGGILQGTVPTATALTVTNPGVFNLTANQTIGSLAGNGGVTLNAFNLTTGGNNTSTTYSGIISGAGGLTKTGAGTFTLLGANTYTGGTTITGGTLTGNTTSLTGNIVDNAALVFNQAAAGTFAGV
ncbi:MAG: autotransporter-associated beta strand repeat-containing protein, partial [Alphaproteobacteria bacterium]|nr:autotransporter-associated beta strand repeat-containing protein [Alphaproteobacteria bacterium]